MFLKGLNFHPLLGRGGHISCLDGKSLVTEEVCDEIENAKSKKEANKIFLKHLLNAGTEESLKFFCTVLQKNSYRMHYTLATPIST